MLTCSCNMCGKKMDGFDIESGLSIVKTVGYGSVFDGETIRLDLCVDCFDDLLKSCKISPWSNPGGAEWTTPADSFHLVGDDEC